MTGERDLAALLRGLSPRLNDGPLRLHAGPGRRTGRRRSHRRGPRRRGVTLVLTQAQADELDLTYEFVAAWITLEIHSALDAVGLTAAVSHVLTGAGISANVVAGYTHDHIFVPLDRADDAMRALATLS